MSPRIFELGPIYLRRLRVLVFLCLLVFLITACGDETPSPPITDIPVDFGGAGTTTPEAIVSTSKTDDSADAGGTATVTTEPTATTSDVLDLHPSSYIDCEGLALYDSMFIQEISSNPIALQYFGLEMVTDGPYFMYCKGMAVFQTVRMPNGEPPHERLLMAQLIPKDKVGVFVNARRGDPLQIGNIVPIEDVYISITSGVESSGSK